MIRRMLSKLGFIRKIQVNALKTLTVVTHIEPFVSLRPLRIELHLCTDYYDSGWVPKDGTMFGKEYPGIALGWGLQSFYDAAEYARGEGYNRLVVKRLLRPGVVEPIYEIAL